ncbi:MAG: hypothetical protein AB1656_27085 [Candidatus Omnitrophota bacterium]
MSYSFEEWTKVKIWRDDKDVNVIRRGRITALAGDWLFRTQTKRFGLCLLFALAQGAIFIGAQYNLTGALSFPLDDSFIHLQYAKQMARGAYFQYHDGEPVSGGETSFLYVHVLAFGYLVGFHGIGLIIWSHIIALFSVAGVFYSLLRLGEDLSRPWIGLCSAGLVFCSGYMAWAFWGGMEIALFTCLLLFSFHWLLRNEGYSPLLGLLLGLTALSRPEGVIIAAVLIFLLAMKSIWNGSWRQWHVQSEKFWSSLLFLFFSLIGPSLFYLQTMGRSSGNGLVAKSLFYNPFMTLYEKTDTYLSNLFAIVKFFFGHPSITPLAGEYILPGLLLFAFAGWLGVFLSRSSQGKWIALWLGAPIAVSLAAAATLEVWSLHSFRYLVPLIPLFLLMGAAGIDVCFSWIADRSSIPALTIAAAALLIHISYFPHWIARFSNQSATIYEKQVQTAHWLVHNQIPGTIAINDAGALVYFGDFPAYDLVGLTTNGVTLPYRLGEGALYEELEHIPPENRPQVAAVFPLWFKEMARTYDIFYRPLVEFPDPFDKSFEKTVYRINWEYAGMEESPRNATIKPGWTVRDFLDAADVHSEKNHNYACKTNGWRHPEIPIPFRRNFGYHEEIDETWPNIENEREELIPRLRQQGILNRYDIVDAGRRINGEESFNLFNLTPGAPVHLILRTCDNTGKAETFAYRMELFADDVYLGEWNVSGTPWNWRETVFDIPGESVKRTWLKVRIVNRGTLLFPYYDSYFYWACQDEAKLELNNT